MVLSENDNTSLVLDELEQSILLVARRLISRHYLLNTKILYSECTRTMKDVDRGKIAAFGQGGQGVSLLHAALLDSRIDAECREGLQTPSVNNSSKSV